MGTSIYKSTVNPYTPTGGLFTQLVNSTPVADTTSPGSLLGSGIGILSVPANGFKKGDTFSLTMWGHLSADNNQKLSLNLISNGVTVLASAAQTLPGIADKHWNLQVTFVIRDIGGPGFASILTSGSFTYTKTASSAFEGFDFSIENNTTFDTTIDNALDVVAIWDNALPGNSIYSELTTLHKIY